MDATLKQERRAVSAVLALALAALTPTIALAQDASPGGFSLPAGTPPPQQPPSDVQGPVDAESDPPRRTDEPAPSTPAAPLPSIAPVPVPVPTPQQRQPAPVRERASTPRPQREQPAPAAPQPAPSNPDAPVSSDETAPVAEAPAATPVPLPLPVPQIPGLPPETVTPEMDADEGDEDGSIWWWLAAGLVALVSLIVMALRQRSAAKADVALADEPVAPVATVPTPPLRTPPPVPQPAPPQIPPARAPSPQVPFGTFTGGGTSFGAAPDPAPAPAPAPEPRPQAPVRETPPAAPAVSHAFAEPVQEAVDGTLPQPPRLLLDFTTLGVDVTLVNAIARYHLGITNMSDILVSDVALHGAVVQARRGMPPTIDPMRGDSVLPLLQKVADIDAEKTQRCEGQIRLPLQEIEPIEMQGRLLFVPVVHIWIGYTGPDGTRYAVTQSFVLGEESSPPGPRVGPLRLDLGPRRFTEVGQRPLQPA